MRCSLKAEKIKKCQTEPLLGCWNILFLFVKVKFGYMSLACFEGRRFEFQNKIVFLSVIANSTDTDELPHLVPSYLGVHCMCTL